MPAVITQRSSPALLAAFQLIEVDNGAHLIGTVYPGEKIELDQFEVPDAWQHLIAPAETGLSRLQAAGPDDWQTFLIGCETEQDAIRRRQGDLDEAHQLINAWFDAWPEDGIGSVGR